MRRYFVLTSLFIVYCNFSSAQSDSKKYFSIGIYNTQNELPYGKFAGLFSEIFHPGIETGIGKNFSSTNKHDWFAELKISYFYHRFIQHGIPVYGNLGYRYKFSDRFSAEASLGLGYMHSIPASSKFKLENGEYTNNKGVGRMQGMVNNALGINYAIHPVAKKPITAFLLYQQRLQLPFIKSYVPLLPYNSFQLGVKLPLATKPSSTQSL
jgi:hypothetical protein